MNFSSIHSTNQEGFFKQIEMNQKYTMLFENNWVGQINVKVSLLKIRKIAWSLKSKWIQGSIFPELVEKIGTVMSSTMRLIKEDWIKNILNIQITNILLPCLRYENWHSKRVELDHGCIQGTSILWLSSPKPYQLGDLIQQVVHFDLLSLCL